MTEGLSCYRAYLLGASGGITDVEVIQAANDADAVAALRTMRHGHGIELWDRDRRIVTTGAAAAPCTSPRSLASDLASGLASTPTGMAVAGR